VLSSDHFYPWGETQGQSGFAWSWLGAAMQATDLHYGIVNAPGQRCHPTIIAQAVATLCEMFPIDFESLRAAGSF
jgi:coenzyme F420-dependent glucose-6-phosphate dehydrogenase